LEEGRGMQRWNERRKEETFNRRQKDEEGKEMKMIVVCEGIFGYIDGRKDGFGFGIGGIFCSPSLGVLDSAGL
jgi:hypothetical protein